MSGKSGRLLTATVAAGLVLSLGCAALAAQVGALKQFKVPPVNSEPRPATNGSGGNRWFTEGTDFTNAPAKFGRVTPAGKITDFAANCPACIPTDIAEGSDGIFYVTTNDPLFFLRFDPVAGTFHPSKFRAGARRNLAVEGDTSGCSPAGRPPCALIHHRRSVHVVPARLPSVRPCDRRRWRRVDHLRGRRRG